MNTEEALDIIHTSLMAYVEDCAGRGTDESEGIDKAYQVIEKILNPSDMDKMVERASHLLSNDIDEIPAIIEKLQALGDKSVSLDFAIDDILVWEPLEHYYTVDTFLEHVEF